MSNESWRTDKRTTAERGYGSRWQRARKTFLSRAENALCRMCEASGRVTAATVVDHVKPHKGDQALFWDSANWQPLCKACHDGAKARQESRGIAPGHDATGWPIDPAHPWNIKRET